MRFSSRYKLIIVFSLIFVIGLALFRFTQTATHAVSTPTKVTSTSRENCGNWNIVSSSTSTYPNNILSAVTVSNDGKILISAGIKLPSAGRIFPTGKK